MFRPQILSFAKMLGVSVGFFDELITLYVFIGMWGYIMHLIADMVTFSGIPLLYPLSKKSFYIVPYFLRVKTKSTGEFIYATVYVLIIVYLLLTQTALIR